MSKVKKETPIVKLNDREALKEKQNELDKLDVESAKKALNEFFQSNEWTRYGCNLLPQGQFIGDKIQTGLVVVKAV